MKILITGASGFLGRAFKAYFLEQGHQVLILTRGPGADQWDPLEGRLNPSLLEGIDALIHLSGENIAGGRWTLKKKERILKSRVDSTSLIRKTIQKVKKPPKVWINASATGYYGDRGEDWVDEESSCGTGFLAEVCSLWEEATWPLESCPTRIVLLRTGIVLSGQGGVLKKMLTPFRFGLGGVIGSGKQYMSWIDIQELCQILSFILKKEHLIGPLNAVTEYPVTNREWTKILGSILHRPTFFSMPDFAAKLLFGEMAEALLLAGARVYPKKLLSNGYCFQKPKLEEALRALLDSSY